ncbi:NUDIX hydrolase [Rhizobium sp. S152]|uniref:NUDIX hydrolase n=1 Tax=Rhizobium sp. S152 TaxID=3055038 RepID=UPI0025A97E7F|nr:NUDIX hydrolase [Rhizobium sp. S152]MDM9628558.1 NUDIX hydrolase [Rhizobium sp. S152]
MSVLARLLSGSLAPHRKRPLQQVGGLCFRINDAGEPDVLLITTRETKRWTIPKGWPIAGLSQHKSAKQEAWEEAGVKGKVRIKPFGSFIYDKVLPNGDAVPADVQVHLIKVRETRSIFPERGQRELAWVSASEASRRVGEPGLKKLFAKLARRYSTV